MHAAAEEAGLELLIRCDDGRIHHRVASQRPVGAIASSARHRARDQAAVIAPRRGDVTMRLADAETGTRVHHNDEAVFVAIFGWWRALDHLHRLKASTGS